MRMRRHVNKLGSNKYPGYGKTYQVVILVNKLHVEVVGFKDTKPFH